MSTEDRGAARTAVADGAAAGCADDVAAIAAGIDDMYAAFLAGDRQRFDAHLHPDVTTWETHLPGPLRTRAELDAYRDQRDVAGQRPALRELSARDKRIDVWGDTGVARYVLVAGAAPAGTPAAEGDLAGDAATGDAPPELCRVTDVLRRSDEAWLIVHHHSELVPPDGAA